MFLQLTKAAAAVTAAMLLAACHTDTPETLLAEARQYHQQGNDPAAVIQLKNALEKNPDLPEARFLLASISLATGDALAAEKEARRALALQVPAERVLPVLGKALALQGRAQAALDDTAQGPRTPALLALRGNAFLMLGKPDEARQAFDAALAGQPGHGEAQVGLARLAASQKDWPAALRLLDVAIAKDGRNVEAWQLKGDVLRVQDKPEEAMAAYRAVLKLEPAHRTAHLEQAALHIAAGKYEAAQADIEAARKISPNTVLVTYNQALLDFSRQRMAEAQAGVLKVMQVAPNYMPAVLLAGAVALELGQLEQAEQDLRRYVEWHPANLYARKMLVSTLLKGRQVAQAQAVLAPVLKDGGKDASVLELAGEAAMLGRQYGNARDYFEQATRLDPQRSSIRASLGLARLAQGDRAGSVADLEAAVQLAPTALETGATLVRVQTSMGQYDKALASVARLQKSHANSALLHNLAGGAWLGKKDERAARTSFEAAVAADPAYYPAAENLARLDLQGKDAAGAKRRFEKVLAKDGNHAAAMAALARLALAQGDKAGASAWLEKAVAGQPDALGPALTLAEHYLATAEPAKALALLGKRVATQPAHAGLLALLGRAQLATRDADGAVETFSKLASLDPLSGAALTHLANAQLARKNVAAAAAALKKAVTVEPGHLQAYLLQVDIAMQQRDSAGALATLRTVQQRFPQSPVPWLLEGDVHMMQEKPAQAVRAYERAYATAQSAPLLIKLAKALYGSGNAAEADRHIAEYRKRHPAETLVALYVAENLVAAGQHRQAIAELESVVKTTPDNIAALNNLALAYQQEKDARALPTAEKAYRLAGEHPLVMDTLGWLLVELGDPVRGLPLLQAATRHAPDAADIRLHLAHALLKTGDRQMARKELEYLVAKSNFPVQQDAARSILKQL